MAIEPNLISTVPMVSRLCYARTREPLFLARCLVENPLRTSSISLSLLLVPIFFVSAWYGSFMNGYMGEQVAHQYSSLVAVLAYPVAGVLLFIQYYREKKNG